MGLTCTMPSTGVADCTLPAESHLIFQPSCSNKDRLCTPHLVKDGGSSTRLNHLVIRVRIGSIIFLIILGTNNMLSDNCRVALGAHFVKELLQMLLHVDVSMI